MLLKDSPKRDPDTCRGSIDVVAQHGLSEEFMTKFWKRLWRKQQPRKIAMFQWLMVHKAITVGEWMSKMKQPTSCKRCGCLIESQAHFLWNCHMTQQVWNWILRTMTLSRKEIVVLWGSALWASNEANMVEYEAKSTSSIWAIN